MYSNTTRGVLKVSSQLAKGNTFNTFEYQPPAFELRQSYNEGEEREK